MSNPSHEEAWKKLGEACVLSAMFDSPERQSFSQCLPGTRIDLLRTLRQTIREENRRIIWLSGESGSGKSAVAYTLAEQCRADNLGWKPNATRGPEIFQHPQAPPPDNLRRMQVAATFFFSRRDPIRSTTERFIPTISYQLGLLHPHAKNAITKAIVDDSTLLKSERSRYDQFLQLVLAPLRALRNIWKEDPRTMIMIVDALDEVINSGHDSVRELVDFFLRALQQKDISNFHIVITSRLYTYIQNAMCSSPLVLTLTIENFVVHQDIKLFLQTSLDEIRNIPFSSLPQSWPSDDTFQLFVEQVSRSFIVAVTAIRLLKQKLSSEMKDFLDALSQTQQMTTIDELYRHVISISDHASEGASLLTLIVSLSQPLPVDAISSLVQYDARPFLDSIAAIVSAPLTHPVTTYHTSLRDFFGDKTRSQQFYRNPSQTHLYLACACLRLMVRTLVTDICNLGDPSLVHTEIDGFYEKRDKAISPALAYAVTHLIDHLREATPDSTLRGLLVSFVKENLLHWIEVVSLLGVIRIFSPLREVAEVISTWELSPEQNIINTLFYDTYRLVHHFSDPISDSALHVYHTALPLCPLETKLREVYKAYLSTSNTIAVEGLDRHWGSEVQSINIPGPGKSVECISSDGRLAAEYSRDDLTSAYTFIELWDIHTITMVAA
ncbi:hypothetical protein CONPUDRAFT_166806 [Coniophora puteana RWD-64-598 SS2]|uniref:Nephrocystin 3-like N-terminal domain-containing protein n=1 Tax=Coniophora puteana (strain RWD-64-598) TaxID=741705 RepID=A0A5M3MIM3_CONPW|nr:uncharacterized protein CONPUDRAFT_166806 [Coniophora puteana RWD-64-598 SS2]EIW78953.1 hypothetical protein CONPUDRAFT_166806 [Coniophora puteana RWD-64-598 SS2]